MVVKPNETKSVETEEAHSADKSFLASGFSGGFAARPAFFASQPGIPGPPLASPVAHMYLGGLSNMRGTSLMVAAARPSFDKVGSFEGDFDSDLLTENDRVISSKPHPTTTPHLPRFTLATTTVRVDKINDTELTTSHNMDNSLIWLKKYISVENETEILTLDNKTYLVGSKDTVVETQQCKVEKFGIFGNCTLISSCPSIYSELTDIESFKEYFCTLASET